MQTENHPDACAGSGARFHESTLFGNVFQGKGRFIAIAGGAAAHDPYLNARYSTVLPTSATVYQYGEHRCVLGGAGDGLYAQYCDSDDGRWHHPVVVLTGADPGLWYYNVASPASPPAF